jgi:hypothetical protein
MLDREFFKARAEHCRSLADGADPFIKRRLLDLAARYDGRFTKKRSIASIMLDEYLEQARTGPKHAATRPDQPSASLGHD